MSSIRPVSGPAKPGEQGSSAEAPAKASGSRPPPLPPIHSSLPKPSGARAARPPEPEPASASATLEPSTAAPVSAPIATPSSAGPAPAAGETPLGLPESVDPQERLPQGIDLPNLPLVDPLPPLAKEPMPARPPTHPQIDMTRDVDRRRFVWGAIAVTAVLATVFFVVRCEDPSDELVATTADNVLQDGQAIARTEGGVYRDGRGAPGEQGPGEQQGAGAADSAGQAASAAGDDSPTDPEKAGAAAAAAEVATGDDSGGDAPVEAAGAEAGAEAPAGQRAGDEAQRAGDTQGADDSPGAGEAGQAATRKQPPDPRTAAELLEAARKAYDDGDAKEAYRLATLSFNKEPTEDALEIKTLAACKLGNKETAKAAYRNLGKNTKRDVRKTCRDAGVWLI